MTLDELLTGMEQGSVTRGRAEEFLRGWGFVEVGYHRIDLHRETRSALPEVVFGLPKTADQLDEIVGWFVSRELPLLATKVDPSKAEPIVRKYAGVEYRASGALLMRGRSRRPSAGSVGVLTAGSSDVPVAEEAAGTLEFFGLEVARSYDCGVAGLHRLLARGETISAADVLIVVAGMEGALPSVVGGLFRQPIVAVPTSVGYGASFEGLAALLAMMNA
ncbi:MAG TPA: nickel pincer cofactor biosynthesis protein LarB, partial [Thermoanaerobaculia bacterium]|nr:nickel pincer cofactor biosynthesis protein LarB [Thermoanaerobaculia bacterium]